NDAVSELERAPRRGAGRQPGWAGRDPQRGVMSRRSWLVFLGEETKARRVLWTICPGARLRGNAGPAARAPNKKGRSCERAAEKKHNSFTCLPRPLSSRPPRSPVRPPAQ